MLTHFSSLALALTSHGSTITSLGFIGHQNPNPQTEDSRSCPGLRKHQLPLTLLALISLIFETWGIPLPLFGVGDKFLNFYSIQ